MSEPAGELPEGFEEALTWFRRWLPNEAHDDYRSLSALLVLEEQAALGRPLNTEELRRSVARAQKRILRDLAKRQSSLGDDAVVAADTDRPDSLVNSKLLLKHLVESLRELLTFEEFIAFRLAYVEELDRETVADILGIGTGALTSRLHRIRRKLQEAPSLREFWAS